MQTDTKISKLQRDVLTVLAEHFEDDMGNCLYIRTIASEANLEHRVARLAVRALARKGLAVYERGLFDEDGMVAGSGYRASFEGALLINECHHKCGSLIDMVTGECQQCWEKRRVYAFTDDWGDYKKGDTVTKEQLGDGDIFKTLYWGTYEKMYSDKKLVDATPTPAWCCQECGNKDCCC